MKNKNNIEDWYKNELENFSVQSDKNSWNKISDKLNQDELLLDEKIDQWYKNELENKQQQPDFKVWAKLSANLDTATVWERLSVTLTHYNKLIWWRNAALKTVAIAIFIMGIVLTYNNFVETEKSNTSNKYAATINKSNDVLPIAESPTKLVTQKPLQVLGTENIDLFVSIAATSKQIENKIAIKKSTSVANKSIENDVKNKKNNFASNSNENYVLSKNTTSISNPTTTSSINSPSFQYELKQNRFAKEFLIKKENNKIVFNNKRFSSNVAFGVYARRFYFGVNSGIKKQSVIAIINKNKDLKNDKQHTLLAHGVSVGVTFGKIISDKFNIETNVNFYSTNGYRKRLNFTDKTIDERLNLSYKNVAVLAKRMFNKSTFDSKIYSTNVFGGVYVSYLSSSTSKINNQTVKNNDYSNLDMGIVLGIEQDRYLTKTLVITPGIRYSQGLKNIATAENNFSSIYNYTLEFNVGLKYIFLKKNK